MNRSLVLPLLLVLAPACDSKKDAAPAAQSGAPGSDAKAKAEPEKPAAPKEYGDEFCATIIPCYQQVKFNGNFSADVTVDIEPDGSVASVSFTGEAPKPVETCIVDTIKGIELADYNGKPGRTRCTQSGQLSGGGQMVMSDMEYSERAPGDAKADDAKADDAKADDAKADDAKADDAKAGDAKAG